VDSRLPGRRLPTPLLVVMDRWSLSDKQVYGAEDDDEMDAIMSAIDARLVEDSHIDSEPSV